MPSNEDIAGAKRQADIDRWVRAGYITVDQWLSGYPYDGSRRVKGRRYELCGFGFALEEDGREPWPTKDNHGKLSAILEADDATRDRALCLLGWIREGVVVYNVLSCTYRVGPYVFSDPGPDRANPIPSEFLFAQIALAVQAGAGETKNDGSV